MLWLRLLSRPWQWQWQGEYFGIRLREGGREGRGEEGGSGLTAWRGKSSGSEEQERGKEGGRGKGGARRQQLRMGGGEGARGEGEAPLLVGADSAAACFEKATEVIWREGEELYNKLKMVCLLGLDCVNQTCHSEKKIRWFGNSLNRGLSQQLRIRTRTAAVSAPHFRRRFVQMTSGLLIE